MSECYKECSVPEEFDLNVGGLVGAVACIEGTGRLVTGTRNDESGTLLSLPQPGNNHVAGNRLTVHTTRDAAGRILGLGGGGGDAGSDGDQGVGVAGWEPVTETWTEHDSAVTGLDIVKGYGKGVEVSALVTAGGDGCIRLTELDLGDDDDNDGVNDEEEDFANGGGASPSLTTVGQIDAHKGERATGVAATRRRAVTVGEDGCACLVDLELLGGMNGQRIGASNGGGGWRGGSGGVIWRGQPKGGLPLSGVTFQGEQEEVFATSGCDPRGQLMLWDTRSNLSVPSATFGCVGGSVAPYLCVASQPFNPEVFACGASTGEVLLWDIRTKDVLHELVMQDRDGPPGGAWGVAFHPRRPKHMFSATGAGVLMKWLLPDEAHGPNGSTAVFGGGNNNSNGGGYRFGAGGSNGSKSPRMDWIGGERLYALPSRFAFVGVCYDEGADTVSAVSKHGTVVMAQGIPGLRL